MNAHTAGPWTVGDPTRVTHDYPKRYTSESVSIHVPGRACVATVYGGCEGGSVGRPFIALEDGRANARLIAAAPEMLHALKDVLDYWDSNGFSICDAGCNCVVEEVRAAIAKAEGAEQAVR